MTVRASIVIRTLNEGRHLPDVLQMLDEQTIPCRERETIIVDSGSTDATLDAATRAGCRILHISREEFSFGRSLNRGCGAASGNVIVFVSGHCVPKDSFWLERLIEPIERGEASITYGRQIGGDDTKYSEHQVFAKYFPAQGEFGQPFFCNNANAAVSAELWRALTFAEELTGLEDMEFAKRAHAAAGARLLYVPDAIVYHHHAESWRQIKRRYEREAYALQHIMPELHFTAWDAIRCFVGGIRVDLRQAPIRRKGPDLILDVIRFRFCQFYGAWKGHHTHRQLSRARKQKYFYPD